MFGQTLPRVAIGSVSLLALVAGLASGCVSATQPPAQVRQEAVSPQPGNVPKASIEDRRVVDLQGILQDQPGEFRPVPTDIFTTTFMVNVEVKPIQPSAWNDGTNTRFVKVTRESDGQWRVSSIASSP